VRAHNVVSGTYDALGIAFLWGDRETMLEEGPRGRIVELTPIITLNTLNGAAKLSGLVSEEMCQNRHKGNVQR